MTVDDGQPPAKTRRKSSPARIKHNRMATIIAMSEGFMKLKNKDQRVEFAKEVLEKYGEDINDSRYYGIIETAETLYWFGILPVKVNDLLDSCESVKEIAQTLGHTELRVQRALDYAVPDFIQDILEDGKRFAIKRMNK
jgi:hypothetical protein